MKQSILVLPAGCLISGPAGPAGAAGAAGPAGAPECIGFISEAQVRGAFVGPGQVIFCGPDIDTGFYVWANDYSGLASVAFMALVMEVVDPGVPVPLYRLKLLVRNAESWRSVSVPRQYIVDEASGITLWAWMDAVLMEGEGITPHYRLKNAQYSGYCGYTALHALSTLGDEILLISEQTV